ncbi:hypothetical protein HGM15179_008649 [Zosterops borbonicus]|uniref:Uncharacterized protein n=1 Tax=Zosterops borbonicus TaxID=364589 RepID=A0A8K1GIP2_9PASS|nr:hypothetical protein HGM15179_008649 [Zosterops borbonicus]
MGKDWNYTRLLKALSSLALDTSRDGAATASLGTLCQDLTTVTVKNSFQISRLNPPSVESTVVPNSGLVSVSFILLGVEENTLNTLLCAPTPEDAPKTVASPAARAGVPTIIPPTLSGMQAEMSCG